MTAQHIHAGRCSVAQQRSVQADATTVLTKPVFDSCDHRLTSGVCHAHRDTRGIALDHGTLQCWPVDGLNPADGHPRGPKAQSGGSVLVPACVMDLNGCRGAGEVLGKKQSGAKAIGCLRACSLPRDQRLLEAARAGACRLLDAHGLDPSDWPPSLLAAFARPRPAIA